MKKIEISDFQVKEIKQLYFKEKQTLKQIADKYNLGINTIKRVLVKNFGEEYKQESKRNYNNLNIDSTFFDCIDNENKAYLLGYFFADGNMYFDVSYKLRFCLAYQDIDILYKFKEILHLDSKVRVYTRKDRKNSQSECNLEWSSKEHYLALKSLGITSHKTEDAKSILEFINKAYIHHFIRGFFDGDGCITIKRIGTKEVSFVGTYDVISKLRDFLCLNLDVYPIKISKRTKKHTVYQISWASKEDVSKIFDYMYKDATIFLKRKYEKFIK